MKTFWQIAEIVTLTISAIGFWAGIPDTGLLNLVLAIYCAIQLLDKRYQ